MADQIFNIKSGFYDAVNSDRTYSAEDMNKPYSRVVGDGVFATQTGTPSDDLQVVTANNGMKISVLKGQAILASKWFENPATIVITVPDNTSVSARIDSVLMQINRTQRVGTIVYRTGSANTQPAINTDSGVVEMRLANISVPSNARQITNANITDLRGSEDCPWVTGLITQVDTSTLFAQYRAAYNEFYDEISEEYDAYVEQQRENWEAFIAQLTEELEVTPNTLTYSSTYTATGAVANNIPIGIAVFDKDSDDLQVFINGIFAPKTDRWTLDSGGTSITLTSAIAAGDVVNFLVFKSVVTGNVQAISVLLDEINDKLDAWTTDTTLTIAGAAADAKIVGDKFSEVEAAINDGTAVLPIDWKPSTTYPTGWRNGYYGGDIGGAISNNNSSTQYIRAVWRISPANYAELSNAAFIEIQPPQGYAVGVRVVNNDIITAVIGVINTTQNPEAAGKPVRIAHVTGNEYYISLGRFTNSDASTFAADDTFCESIGLTFRCFPGIRYDKAQTLSAEQKALARQNLGVDTLLTALSNRITALGG